MHKLFWKIGLTALLGLLSMAPAWGQPLPGPTGPARGLDLSKLETLTGTIAAVNRLGPRTSKIPPLLQLLLKTDQETVAVNLGPADYVEQQGLKFAQDDQVQVKGVRVSQRQPAIIVAVEVQKGAQVLRLRNETGRPLWPLGCRLPPGR